MTDLLPPSASAQERAFDQVCEGRLAIDLAFIDELRPGKVKADRLEHLAWTLSVDIWDPSWPEETRRAAVAAAVDVHRRKGTPGAIRRLLDAIGYGVTAIIEGADPIYHDGEHLHDGSQSYAPQLDASSPPLIYHDGKSLHDGASVYGEPLYWATYRVVLDRPMTLAQAEQARRLLAAVAPARCHLVELRFTEVAFLYDGSVSYGGAVSYGAA